MEQPAAAIAVHYGGQSQNSGEGGLEVAVDLPAKQALEVPCAGRDIARHRLRNPILVMAMNQYSFPVMKTTSHFRGIVVFTFTLCCAFLCTTHAAAQAYPSEGCSIRYLYDDAGNRTTREWYCWGEEERTPEQGRVLEDNSLRAYPNPARDMVTVQLEREVENAQVELMDTQGKVLQNERLSGNTLNMSVSQLSNGLYWIRVLLNGEMLVSEFSKE